MRVCGVHMYIRAKERKKESEREKEKEREGMREKEKTQTVTRKRDIRIFNRDSSDGFLVVNRSHESIILRPTRCFERCMNVDINI